MKYSKIIGLILSAFPSFLLSQDVMVLKNSDEIKSRVIEITDLTLKYKKWDNVNGPMYSINKNTILFIRYENGTKEVFATSVEPVAEPERIITPVPKKPSAAQSIQNQTVAQNIQELDYQRQGQNDALQFYKGENSGKEWIGGITTLATPAGGAIPAIACLSKPPSDRNLLYPDRELFENNSVYANAYRKQAHEIKKHLILKNYKYGCVASAVFILALIII